MHLGSWNIDEHLTFPANLHDPATGGESDGDSDPTYRIYEDETGTPLLTGTMAVLDGSNTTGFYTERVQLTAANGFERGKSYTVFVRGIVGGVAATLSHTFQIGGSASVDYWRGTQPNTLTSGRVEVLVGAVTNGVIAAASFASNALDAVWATAARTLTAATNITSTGGTTVPQTGDAYAIVNSGTHGNAALKTLIDTLDDYVDTEVAAIKAKTDNLPAAPAATGDIPTANQNAAAVLAAADSNPIAANVKEVNDVTLNGDGAGTPWGP